jgi:hypothetical protein
MRREDDSRDRRRHGFRKGSARGAAKGIIGGVCLLVITAAFALAGGPAVAQGSAAQGAIGVVVATGLGSMSTDLNGHPGFGIAVQGYLPVAPRFDLRPAFEWTGYRINEYNLAALALVELFGGSYEDTRVVFRTYRLGLDGVVYLRDRDRGPFLSGGAGVQVSRVYIEDVIRSREGVEDITPLHASSATTGLWLGSGVGYAWEVGSVELRLARAPYRFTGQRRADRQVNAFPLEARPGWALQLMLAVRFPA